MYRGPFNDEDKDHGTSPGAFGENDILAYPMLTTFLGGYVDAAGKKIPPGNFKLTADGTGLVAVFTYADSTWFARWELETLATALPELEACLQENALRWRQWTPKTPRRGS